MGAFKLQLPRLGKIIESDRLIIATLLLTIALIIIIVISLSFGAVSMTTAQIWQALTKTGDPLNQIIIWDLRLPRTLAAVLVGAALGMSGSLLQGMLRNGLADPFLLGISAGAGLFAIAMLSFGVFLSWIPLAAWVGSLLTTIIVYFLARSREGISIERLILGGVAINNNTD